jgi:PKD domain-containing protein
MGRMKLILLVLATGGVFAPPTAGQAAPELFEYSPAAPFTNELITFTAKTDGSITWDLDGDGECDDAAGPSASRSFASAGAYEVRICVNGDETIQRRTVSVRNRTPVASFTYVPQAPMPGDVVTMTSSSSDPDGPITAQSWDLDADSAFDDAFGGIATVVYGRSGTYPVALQVVDRDGATGLAFAWIKVARPPARPLSPIPIVRVDGSAGPTGVVVRVFAISAPRGVRIAIRCRGGGCPYAHKRLTTRHRRTRVHSLERRLRAGTVVEVRVTKQGRIGKYMRLRVRRGIGPARVDRCLRPGLRRPVRCPAS